MKIEGKRKFVLAFLALASAVILCWFHRMTGGECVTALSLSLALYKAANIVDKKLGGAG